MKVWQALTIALGIHAGIGGWSIVSNKPTISRLELVDADAVLSNIDQIAIVRFGVESDQAEQADDIKSDLNPEPTPEPHTLPPETIETLSVPKPSMIKETVSLHQTAEQSEPLQVTLKAKPDAQPVKADVRRTMAEQKKPSATIVAPAASAATPVVTKRRPVGHPESEPAPNAKSQPALSSSQKRTQQRYLAELMRWLAKHRNYPPQLKKAKIEGTTKVRFTIRRDGHISDASVAESSGNAELDAAALGVLALANPGPKFPRKLPRDSFTLTLPIEFSLITE